MRVDITLRTLTGTGSPVLTGMISAAGLVEQMPTGLTDANLKRLSSRFSS